MTPDRLTQWLGDAGALGAGRVSAVREEPVGRFSAELVRLHLRFEPPSETGPATVIAKRRIAGRRDRPGERFDTEVRFYRELAATLPARTPRYLGGDPSVGVLLLEDLRGLRPTDWLRGPSDRHARMAVETLARVHAAFRGRVDALDWVPSFADPELLASFESAYERGLRARASLFEEVVPGFRKLGERLVGRIADSHRALAEEPTLLHGDAHAENLPLRSLEDGSEELVALDWAGPRRGNAGVDLGFFVAMSFPAGRRPEVEHELVALHHATLRERGVSPGMDPWLAYRFGVLRRISRLVGIAEGWDAGALDGLKMVFHRCARAALELDVGELV